MIFLKHNKFSIIFFISLLILSCDDKKKSSNPTKEETFEFLIQMIDNKDVRFIDDLTYTNVGFKVKDIETCECEFSYTFKRKHIIQSFNFSDSYEAYLAETPANLGYYSDYVLVRFKKESVKNEGFELNGNKIDLAFPWLKEINIWVNKNEGTKILKGVKHIIEKCAQRDKTDLFD